MQIHIAQPVAFSHIGQRALNQDTLLPAVGQATEKTSLFIICDGMGGADKGEIASQLLCNAVYGYTKSMGSPVLDSMHLRTALDFAYEAYLVFLKQNPLVNRMGSTLALLQFHEYGATVAHLGDSRIYQIRGGKIIFQTKDHRQVNDMVEAGIITASQAVTHPWRNRLSRAVVVNAADREETLTRPSVDCVLLTDIQDSDYFFICTDGVQEQIGDATLEALLTENQPDPDKIDLILAICHEKTKDNYSGYLIGVNRVCLPEPVDTVSPIRNYAG